MRFFEAEWGTLGGVEAEEEGEEGEERERGEEGGERERESEETHTELLEERREEGGATGEGRISRSG